MKIPNLNNLIPKSNKKGKLYLFDNEKLLDFRLLSEPEFVKQNKFMY